MEQEDERTNDPSSIAKTLREKVQSVGILPAEFDVEATPIDKLKRLRKYAVVCAGKFAQVTRVICREE